MNKSIHEIVRENIDTDNIENLRLLSRQGWTSDIFTRENLEYAAVKGSVETTRLMANSHYPTMTHDAKVDAMFAASKAHRRNRFGAQQGRREPWVCHRVSKRP